MRPLGVNKKNYPVKSCAEEASESSVRILLEGRSANEDRLRPIEKGSRDQAAAINTELALYNNTGNVLALWAVVALCHAYKIQLPADVKKALAVGEMATKLVALHNDKDARGKVAGIFLKEDDQDDAPNGDRSVFHKYRNLKRDSAIVARVCELMLVGRERDRQASKGLTLTKVYEDVGQEFNVTPEMIKRLYEADEREAGSFALSTLPKRVRSGQKAKSPARKF